MSDWQKRVLWDSVAEDPQNLSGCSIGMMIYSHGLNAVLGEVREIQHIGKETFITVTDLSGIRVEYEVTWKYSISTKQAMERAKS